MAKSEGDYRKVLGVSDSASVEQIKRAYRKLAMRFHPDRNKGPEAAARFKEIREAYAVLSGKEKPPKDAPPSPRNNRHWAQDTVHAGRDPVPYEVAEWNFAVRRAWDEMESQKHNNAYR